MLLGASLCSGIVTAGNNIDYIAGKRYGNYYYKGNIPSDELPKSIKKYLDKNYPNHDIIVSKRQNNGKYFVKIRFGGNNYRSYYRSLVFDYEGNVIKG